MMAKRMMAATAIWNRGGYPDGDGWPFGRSDISPIGRYVDHARDEIATVRRDEWYMIVRYKLEAHA